MLTSLIRLFGLGPKLWLLPPASCQCKLGRQQLTAQAVASLSLTYKIWIQFLTPGFGRLNASLCGHVWGVRQQRGLSLFLCLIIKA